MYDVIIIGAGASGLSAAIYAGRAKLRTLVIEKSDAGGQIKITSEVVNYPGILKTSGAEFAATMKAQAESFGVEFVSGEVTEVDFSQDIKTVTASGTTYRTIGVIIATGAKPRKLGFEGEQEFAGRGIAYCATCDGEFFSGKDVFVIGAGFAAAEEAIFLTRFAKHVTVIAREPEFTCSKTIADKVLAHEKITVKFNSEIKYVRGTTVVKEAAFLNNLTNESWVHETPTSNFGVFVFVGYEPENTVFKGKVTMNDYGYILTDEDMKTNIEGVYAAGDIRPKRLKQLVTATSDGAIASTAIERYINVTKEKLGITVDSPTSSKPIIPEKILESDTVAQIHHVMDRITGEVSITAILRPDCDLSEKARAFLDEFSATTSKVPVKMLLMGENADIEAKISTNLYPVIAVMGENGNYARACFHGVPGGHELESFILALYNAGGPGQPMDNTVRERIKGLTKPTNIKIGVTLSCTLCPDVVQACQRIAILNDNYTAEMVDLQFYPELRDKFDIMSVPAIIIDDKEVIFGKKGIEELLTYFS